MSTVAPGFSIVAYKDLQFTGKVFGRGGFGIVREAHWKARGNVAVKELIDTNLTLDTLQNFTEEVQHQGQLRHEHIVSLFGACFDRMHYALVMEIMPQGSLYAVLHNMQALPWPTRILIAKDICAGLAYLHEEQIIHRDLKSANVLLNDQMRAKLADFGLAKVKLETNSKVKQVIDAAGTLPWMAPELFEPEGECSKASDVYSLAFTLWELASRKIPFATAKSPALIPMWIGQGRRETIPTDTPNLITDLIKRCWAQRAEDRPNIQQVVQAIMTLPTETDVATEAPVSDYRHFSQERNTVLPTEQALTELQQPVKPTLMNQSEGYRYFSDAPRPQQPAAAADEPANTVKHQPFGMFIQPATKKRQQIDQKAVNQLLLHVAQGEQDQAEAMLQKDNSLALHQGQVTDYSNRTFDNITAFQYALWALDWHMWQMILKYLSQYQAAAQLQELETQGTKHGKHYDFQPLLAAYKIYIDNCDELYQQKNWNELDRLWIKGIGGEQRTVPTHVANEYCRPDRAFEPQPNFKEATLPRVLKLGAGSVWYPLKSAGIGVDFGVFRYKCAGVSYAERRAFRYVNDTLLLTPRLDSAAVAALCQVRTSQLEELKQQLLSKPTLHY